MGSFHFTESALTILANISALVIKYNALTIIKDGMSKFSGIETMYFSRFMAVRTGCTLWLQSDFYVKRTIGLLQGDNFLQIFWFNIEEICDKLFVGHFVQPPCI